MQHQNVRTVQTEEPQPAPALEPMKGDDYNIYKVEQFQLIKKIEHSSNDLEETVITTHDGHSYAVAVTKEHTTLSFAELPAEMDKSEQDRINNGKTPFKIFKPGYDDDISYDLVLKDGGKDLTNAARDLLNELKKDASQSPGSISKKVWTTKDLAFAFGKSDDGQAYAVVYTLYDVPVDDKVYARKIPVVSTGGSAGNLDVFSGKYFTQALRYNKILAPLEETKDIHLTMKEDYPMMISGQSQIKAQTLPKAGVLLAPIMIENQDRHEVKKILNGKGDA